MNGYVFRCSTGASRRNQLCSAQSYNSEDQSPCLMSAYLLGACANDPASKCTRLVGRSRISRFLHLPAAFVKALPPDYQYTGPRNPVQDNPCWCSTVFYSALSMCAICQQRDIISYASWLAFSEHCLIFPFQVVRVGRKL